MKYYEKLEEGGVSFLGWYLVYSKIGVGSSNNFEAAVNVLSTNPNENFEDLKNCSWINTCFCSSFGKLRNWTLKTSQSHKVWTCGRNHRFPSYINKLFVAATAKNIIGPTYENLELLTYNIIFWVPSWMKHFCVKIQTIDRVFNIFIPSFSTINNL